ncbi:rhodanese-related sulfurtransferase [Acidovorax sp. SUPP3334]|uniref:oxygen-dependent tRNA uridine(34) hydroxylase TrhO n=1 Tax=Acidovorax sp. SUPP3334 TaxID=2920881 RepID=UPI0023DE3087|nr:rhodanese-related sulfurtransferase [Acidovorax sp. SUPP3334]
MPEILTAALYHFVDLPDCAALQSPLQSVCETHGVRGLLLLAPEGINGTIAGDSAGVRAVLDWLRADARLAGLRHKEALGDRMPFYRMRVRLKREIVTLGVTGLDPARNAGTHVPPAQWNALIDDPEVVVIDVRNDYEVGIGSFARAINPRTRSFTEFPAWVEQQRAPGGVLAHKPKVAMFCTGGIRCEKSTALLKSQGFDDVFHLEGGILQYLEDVPAEDSRWHGDCFVFDERVSVGHGLSTGRHQLCRSCRMPLGEAELASPQYRPGVSCPYCHGTRTPEQERALAEREQQMALARERGQAHIGARQANTLAADAAEPEEPPQALQAPRAVPSDGLPVLYSFRRCPYAMRARMAIAASGQLCELREVVLRDKPQALRDASPKATVPVLVLPDGSVLEQSLEIMRWALSGDDPLGWLAMDRATAEDADALIATCDGHFKHALDRCKYPGRYLDAPDEPSQQAASTPYGIASACLAHWDARLARHAFLCGPQPTLADVALMPFVRQYAGIDADRWQAEPWPHLRAWLAAWEASEVFTQVMGKTPPWVPGTPGPVFPSARFTAIAA